MYARSELVYDWRRSRALTSGRFRPDGVHGWWDSIVLTLVSVPYNGP
jgi:hypothetical protein